MDSEDSASVFHRYTLQWCTKALARASKPMARDDFPVLNFTTKSKNQALLGLDMPKESLWDQIVRQRCFELSKQWTIMLLRSVVSFGSPYCTMKLLNSLEDACGRMDGPWIWLVGLGVFSLSQTLINYYLVWIQWSEMGVPVRAQLIMSIFQKALRLKDDKAQQTEGGSKKNGKKDTKPEAINLISSDTQSFSRFTAVNYILPSLFVRFIFATLFLMRLLGWQSTLVGMTATLACVPIHAHVIKQERIAKKNLTTARNKKSKVINEAINALRQIKFSASETQWEDHIDTFRQEEIGHIRQKFTASNVKAVWGVAAPYIVAGASSFAYICLHGALAPSIIFPMIELLPHLQGTLGFAPFVFQDYLSARSNAARMETYLRKREHRNELRASPSGRVAFSDASVVWPSTAEKQDSNDKSSPTRFSLNRLNLEFPVGGLSIVTGKTGSGKSLLLTAILGEADILNGHIQAPSMNDRQPVAFVSQTPWLQNATIKDNILLGSPIDEERYKKVLTACVLNPDLAVLEKGDKTVIGLRGVKLSGGQRARLALARAFYSSARLLVLDDIFSALDTHVSNDILNALTGELSAGRTRILVTHQVSLCLSKAKYLVHIDNNTVEFAGDPLGYIGKEQSLLKPEEIPSKELLPSPAVEETRKVNIVEKTIKNKALSQPKENKPKKARTDLKVYTKYFVAAGGVGFTLTYILGLTANQLLDASTKWLLGCLNSARSPKSSVTVDGDGEITASTNANTGVQIYFYLYICSSLLATISESLFKIQASSGSVRASKALFREMTFRVLRMPLIWIDTTPTGDMLKRFTSDTRIVDDSVFDTISEFANCFVKLVIVVSIG